MEAVSSLTPPTWLPGRRLYRIQAGSLTHRQVQRREWVAGMRAIRAALSAQPAAPGLLKAAMPAVALLHRAKVEMLVRRSGSR